MSNNQNELTPKEAAAELGLREDYVQKLCNAGKLGRKYGRSWIITRSELEAFKRNRPTPGRPRKS